VDTYRDQFDVEAICTVIDFPVSTYYEARKRTERPSRRARRDAELIPLIRRVWEDSNQLYGARKIWKQLRRDGVELAGGGFCYTAFVIDVFSRAIVGWQVLDTLKAELALDALDMALWSRRDQLSAALVHHSDRGVQYTAIRYGQRLAEAGIERSVGRKGDSYDNALAESVNALYKKEVIHRNGPWNTVAEVTSATAEWVFWYNTVRLHSWCGDVPPLEYEQSYRQAPPQAA
jgi:transposase InsO family protein